MKQGADLQTIHSTLHFDPKQPFPCTQTESTPLDIPLHQFGVAIR
jgi:hypothetical protein